MEGFVFGGLSLSFLVSISWITDLPPVLAPDHASTFPLGEQFMSRGQKKWCLMRASDMQDMGLWRRNHLCDENKSVSALFGQPPFPFQSCTRLRVFPSIRALAPFSGGAAMKRCDFRGPAVQPGLQFSLSLSVSILFLRFQRFNGFNGSNGWWRLSSRAAGPLEYDQTEEQAKQTGKEKNQERRCRLDHARY